jgi:hypothetical protein
MLTSRQRLVPAMLALLVGAATSVHAAPIILHESTEFFFASGGTHVTNCLGLGCPAVSFTTGPISGDVLWDIQEKAQYDPAGDTTSFAYTVFNETLAAGITSFSLQGGFPVTATAPPGWSFVPEGGLWQWQATDPSAAVPEGLFLAGFMATLPGAVSVGFGPASITLADGGELSSPTWVATTPVPEPPAWLMLGTAALAVRIQRTLRSRSTPSGK